MKNSFVKMWAITMTGMALLLLGVLIGKLVFSQDEKQQYTLDANIAQTANKPIKQEPSVHIPNNTTVENKARAVTSNNNNSENDNPVVYVTPDELANIKTEWRTEYIDNQYKGYAALFDPQRREFIIERCYHQGYFDLASQQPLENAPFCETMVFSQILSLTTELATLRTKTGQIIDMTLALTNDNQLDINLLDTEIRLIPGSKNDLFQLMDNSDSIKKQKQALFVWQDQEYQKERAKQQENNDSSGESP